MAKQTTRSILDSWSDPQAQAVMAHVGAAVTIGGETWTLVGTEHHVRSAAFENKDARVMLVPYARALVLLAGAGR